MSGVVCKDDRKVEIGVMIYNYHKNFAKSCGSSPPESSTRTRSSPRFVKQKTKKDGRNLGGREHRLKAKPYHKPIYGDGAAGGHSGRSRRSTTSITSYPVDTRRKIKVDIRVNSKIIRKACRAILPASTTLSFTHHSSIDAEWKSDFDQTERDYHVDDNDDDEDWDIKSNGSSGPDYSRSYTATFANEVKVIIRVNSNVMKKSCVAVMSRPVTFSSRDQMLDFRWNSYYQELKRFKEINGHLNYPSHTKLGRWIYHQRSSMKNGSMSDSRAKLLQRLGFRFLIPDRWDVLFDRLVQFRNKHGQCNSIPYQSHKNLRSWVISQRNLYREKKLSRERIKKLTSIGFDFKQQNKRELVSWDERFEELLEYKRVHGHCNVQVKDAPSKASLSLAYWVHYQRKEKRKGKLSQDRLDRLNQIGFRFDYLASRWNDHIQELKEFKAKYGHLNVPFHRSSKKNTYGELANWLRHQRSRFKFGNLDESRYKELKKIGVKF